jgi:hypothetical protein
MHGETVKVKNVVTIKGIQVEIEWSDLIFKWSEWSEVLRDKSVMYITVTLYWGYLIILWLFHLGISCTVVVLTCTIVVLTSFVMCGFVYVCVF